MTRGQQERLPVMVSDLFETTGIRPRDLNHIGVTLGPGSFTGLRVGLSFAKGLATGLGLALKGIGTLEALACHPDLTGKVRLSAIDGGRGRIYVQRFTPQSHHDAVVVADDADLGDIEIVTGPAALLLAGRLPKATVFTQDNPVPEALHRLTLLPGHDDITPLYMRDADAVVSTRGIIAPVVA